ncbi:MULTISPECIES: tetratricopeptide repeat protein [Marinobacter]|uniref:tetratricopeptide repeat protein n=1 Tax=Marinobacter TaxID=2742 RepID=UPI001B2F7EB7|nr:tetratricopeptide repeat protein [Marinobacter sp.]MBO6813016.1 tetratricopeptide repeat protein [Marinobacter sp.]MBO6873108.1 tetratricopeptide repeat protein [Marinobacter sp.]
MAFNPFPKTALRSVLLLLLVLGGCAGQEIRQPKESVKTDPELAAKFENEGRTAFEEGRKGTAVKAWKKAVELDPTNAVTVNNLALVLKDQHQFAEAAKLLETGLAYSPDVAELHFNLAVIAELYLLDLETALVHYSRYRELTEEDDQQVAGWIADLERRLE